MLTLYRGHTSSLARRVNEGMSDENWRVVMIPERSWRDVDAAGGLYTAAEVLEIVNVHAGGPRLLQRLRADGHLFSVKRGAAYVYPRFQFDPESLLILPVIADLIGFANSAGWTQEELLLWLCSPSGSFRGGLPAEHLSDPDLVLKTARAAAAVQW